LEREVRPALKADGGDIELIDMEGDKVLVALRACAAPARPARPLSASSCKPSSGSS
jgi:NifU-like protein